jgi:hypothetical protein
MAMSPSESGIIEAASAWAQALEAIPQAEDEQRLGGTDQMAHAEANLEYAEGELYAAVLKWRAGTA